MIVRTVLKIINVCKFFLDFVLPEDGRVFKLSEIEGRAEFFDKKTPPVLAHTSLSYKQPEIRALIHAFKYNKNKSALKICSELLACNIIEISKTLNLSNSILIPIPRTKARIKKFGFNQCDLLCKEILKNREIKKLNLIYEPKILVHHKNYETQTKLSRKERIKNSNKSFSVNSPRKISNYKTILIDDVWTTGATILSAEKSLRESGTKMVIKFTVAH